MRRLAIRVLLLIIGSAQAGCTQLTHFDAQKLSEDTFDRCRDDRDNDGDGLSDCDDPSCVSFSICSELTVQSCGDGMDNDHDGLKDCSDPGCIALEEICVEKTVQTCSDEQDNDGDMLTDCRDPDCQEFPFCQELTAAQCSDDEDNDHDGLADCNDFDCYQHPSCCDLQVPLFSGDDFTHPSDCSIHVATPSDCTRTQWELCSSFDPDRWIAWGLPRARQVAGAFVANEPCGCEASGVVSVESVHLEAGLILSFTIGMGVVSEDISSICAGLTLSANFSDDTQQCSGVTQPPFLVGICLESFADLPPRAVAIIDGVPQATSDLETSDPVQATIRVGTDGVKLLAGPLIYGSPPIDPALDRALVLIAGQGTTAKLTNLSITDPAASPGRCRNPTSWYRHLNRGEPVVPAHAPLLSIGRPSVIYRSEIPGYHMLFFGQRSTKSWSGIFAATSTDGLEWTVTEDPVIPTTENDDRFGSRQTSPAILYWQGSFHVWYTREAVVSNRVLRSIAHATSHDGLTWTPRPGPSGQPFVLGPGKAASWDSLEVSTPAVIKSPDDRLLMWYTGTSVEPGSPRAIGVARSTDGTNWQRLAPDPILFPDPEAMELSYEEPTVAYDPDRQLYMLWHTCQVFGQDASIRHAVSPDAVLWNPFGETSVLEAGPLGAFDERGVRSPASLISDRIQLWYIGINNNGIGQLGYAENRGGP